MPHRKLNRLKDYDYSQNGCYFITICTEKRINHFGEIENGKMILNEAGKVAYHNLISIPEHFTNIIMDECVIMPNHVHGIIGVFDDIVGNAYMHSSAVDSKRNAYMRSLQDKDKTKMLIPKIIQQYKASVTREINFNKKSDFGWQKSFHDHIIRNEKSLNNIREYIHYNPVKWEWDIENKLNKSPDEDYYSKLFVK